MSKMFPKLRNLVIQSSEVKVEDYAFRGHHMLEYLEISNCKLSKHKKDVFDPLISLRSLNLTKTQLETKKCQLMQMLMIQF